MANRYTVTSGLASANSTWDGGASVPGTGDRVLICAGHTVTVDGTREWGDDSNSSITVNGVSTYHSVTVVGTLAFSASVATQLTINGSISFRNGSELVQGTVGTPIPIAYTSNLLLNKSAAMADRKYGIYFDTGSKFSVFGATKKRFTTLASNVSASAASIAVTDATGWRVGDEIYLASTGAGDTNEHETFFIHSSYTNGSATVPLADSGGSAATTVYAHSAPAPVGNYTSNVNITAYDKTYRPIGLITQGPSCAVNTRSMGYCTIEAFGRWDDQEGFTFYSEANYGSSPYAQAVSGITGVAFVSRTTDPALYHQSDVTGETPVRYYDCLVVATGTGQYVECVDIAGYAAFYSTMFATSRLLLRSTESVLLDDCTYACQNKNAFFQGASRGVILNGGTFSGQYENGAVTRTNPGQVGMTDMQVLNCDIAESYANRQKDDPVFSSGVFGGGLTVVCRDSYLGTSPAMAFANLPAMTSVSYVKVINKNRDITLQEEWSRDGLLDRENTLKYRSTSSMRMKPSKANFPFTKVSTVSVATGETLRIIGYCRYDSTYYNSGTGFVAPTLTLSGTINGVTLAPVVYTAASANAGNWHAIDISIVNTSGAPGDITLTFSSETPVVDGLVYWDGIVVAPFVVTARHYGFVFDESNPKRVVNSAVVVSESTAAAYTGVTINTSTPQITVASGTANTFQKVYDYIQAWACLNLTSAVYLTTLDKTNFAIPLACKLEWAGMGADGTLVGGWLLLEAGTHTYKLSGTKIDFTEVGDYNMGGTTFSGTVELVNTSGGAVTVSLPSGVSYTNTGPNITVSVASATLTIAANISLVGAEVRIYDLNNTPVGSLGTELAGTESAPSSTYAYSGTGGNVVWVQILAAGYEEFGQELTLPSTSTTFTALLRLDSNA